MDKLLDIAGFLFSFIAGWLACFFALPSESKEGTRAGLIVKEYQKRDSTSRGFIVSPESKERIFKEGADV